MDSTPSPSPQSLHQLSAQLELGGVDVSASQVHGIACGLVCSGDGVSASTWPRLIADAPDQALPQALERALGSLTENTMRTLGSTDFEFALLLPDDDQSAQDRADALGEWCRGFTLGLFADGRNAPETLPGDAREIVKDVIEIAGSEIDTTDSDVSTEEIEASLMEIEEYLKVGTQLVYEELRDAEAEPDDVSPAPGTTVH